MTERIAWIVVSVLLSIFLIQQCNRNCHEIVEVEVIKFDTIIKPVPQEIIVVKNPIVDTSGFKSRIDYLTEKVETYERDLRVIQEAYDRYTSISDTIRFSDTIYVDNVIMYQAKDSVSTPSYVFEYDITSMGEIKQFAYNITTFEKTVAHEDKNHFYYGVGAVARDGKFRPETTVGYGRGNNALMFSFGDGFGVSYNRKLTW